MNNGNGEASLQVDLDREVKMFFDSAPPLENSIEIREKLADFIQHNSFLSASERGRRVVCVTSGGTTVPLERRAVRHLDNFSSGHRGATSTEYFLKAGYAVIFIYRKGTFQPFCRSLPDDPLLDCFEVTKESDIQVTEGHFDAVKKAILENHAALAKGSLIKLPFSTIFEYLQMLQIIAISLRSLGRNAMFYLAAAVSDFYKPWKDMEEHKIQSGSGPLDMQLVPVPKMLAVLRKEWAPLAFCVSFKLETDTNILLSKADMALRRYNMHAVVANELATRKEEVVVVTGKEKITVRRDNCDVEDLLIKLLVEKHSLHTKDVDDE